MLLVPATLASGVGAGVDGVYHVQCMADSQPLLASLLFFSSGDLFLMLIVWWHIICWPDAVLTCRDFDVGYAALRRTNDSTLCWQP